MTPDATHHPLLQIFIRISLSVIAGIMATGVRAGEFYSIDGMEPETRQLMVTDSFNTQHTIATYRWTGAHAKLVFMVHGYLDNCAYLKPLERWYLNQGYDVVCMELPGHGNSSGPSADISDMSVYRDIYLGVFPQLDMAGYQSTTFIAHSTGNLGMIDYLLDGHEHPFNQIVMVAPLVRSWMWWPSKMGYTLMGWAVQELPRRSIQHKNPAYIEIYQQDPQPVTHSPTHWFGELVEWNSKRADDGRQSTEKIRVIFAEDDSVIDTRYNRQFMQGHFPNAEIVTIANSDHMLHYEEDEVKAAFFEALSKP